MSYIGNPPAEAYTNTVKDTFSGDGSTTAFTMSQISLTNDVRVVVENVVQDPTVAYSCAGTTLTFTSAPPTGTNNIYVVHLGPAVMTALPPAEIAQATTFNSNVSVGGNLTVDTNTLYVDSTNNRVGIGTSSPSSPLHVVGDSSGGFLGGGIRINDTNNSSDWFIGGVASGGLQIAEAAGTTRLRIDSNGNVLVGKADTTFSTAGFVLSNQYDVFQATRDQGNPVELNRTTSDGDIIKLYKDGSAVGSIGTQGGDLWIGTGDTAAYFWDGSNAIAPWNPSTNTTRDAAIDLGASGARWKDLYLSGGVYLGGTGAANKLDDYEEGTWTVTLTPSTSGTISLAGGGGAFYTKIGQVVHISISVTNNSSSSPVGYIVFNLPFAAASGSQKGRSALALYFDGVSSSNVADFIGLTIDGTSEGRIYLGDNPVTQSDSAQQMDGTCYILISGSYITSA